MTQKKIIEKLYTAFAEVENTARLVPEASFFQRPAAGKWSVAENVEHLFLSVKPLAALFADPRSMQDRWGSSSRSSRTYDQMVAAYLEKVGNVGAGLPAYTPKNEATSKPQLIESLSAVNNKFLVRASLFTEAELDDYQVPHPIIGLLTCREFLYFTHYHTMRHRDTIKKL